VTHGKDSHILSLRLALGLVPVFVLSLTIMFMCSCEESRRHEILTFFFDGVPPLGGYEPDANESASDVNTAVSAPGQTPRGSGRGTYVHEAYKDCAQCHGDTAGRGYSERREMAALVPEICYGCHSTYTEPGFYVHGPVAVGECLFCHDPHKSEHKGLLKLPIPEQCYLCHEKQSVLKIEGHAAEAYAACGECHEAHTSSERSLLKRGLKENLD
jgi:predicted CXXCH cytochrome family protein